MTSIADKLKYALMILKDAPCKCVHSNLIGEKILHHCSRCKALAEFPDPDAVVDIDEMRKCSDKFQEVVNERDDLQEQITMRKLADAGIGTVPIGVKLLGRLRATIKAQKEIIYSLQHRCTLTEAKAAFAKLEKR